MAVNLKSTIQQWLLGQHVKVPNDWIEACLEWLKNENHQVNSSNHVQLQALVYEQWLMTDLNQLCMSTIPDGVFQDKFTLNGIYSLQLTSVIDVSQPFYGQLLQVQKKDNSNTMVSAETQFTQKPWEEKASRMLMMKLTDGVVEVSGMEYRNIPILNNNLLPGLKIQIKGPVSCRRGVLMLSQNNVQLLGGEVEELFPANNREAVLCSCLGRPLPVTTTASESNPELNVPEDMISQLTDDFNHVQDSGYVTGGASNQASTDITREIITPNLSSHEDIADINEISDIDMLEELERLESNHVPPESASSETSTSSSFTNSADNQFKKNLFGQRVDPANVVDLTSVADFPSIATVTSLHRIAQKTSLNDAFKNNSRTTPDFVSFSTDKSHSSESKNRIMWTKTVGCNDSNNETVNNLSTKPPIKRFKSDNSNSVSVPQTKPESASQSNSVIVRTVKSESDAPSNNENIDQFKACTSNQTSRNKTGLARFNIEDSLSLLNKNNAMNIHDDALTEVAESSPPYKCLCQVQDRRKMGEARSIFLVKACILTLLSKLQSNYNDGWNLKARIFDGTGMLDVRFSDAVLTDLIGFTSKQAEDAKLSDDVVQSLNVSEGMARCRDAIIDMCKVMEVEIIRETASATVCRLLDTDQRYWDEMQ